MQPHGLAYLREWFRAQWAWLSGQFYWPPPTILGHFEDAEGIPGGTRVTHHGALPLPRGQTISLSFSPAAFEPQKFTFAESQTICAVVEAELTRVGFKTVGPVGGEMRCFFCFTGAPGSSGYFTISLSRTASDVWWCNAFVPPEANADMQKLFPLLIRRALNTAPRSE
jgi:hypothetical protein